MDDLKISSKTLEEHVEHLNLLLKVFSEEGFEFRLKKGQFNKAEIEEMLASANFDITTLKFSVDEPFWTFAVRKK
jgi:hypothetical protein